MSLASALLLPLTDIQGAVKLSSESIWRFLLSCEDVVDLVFLGSKWISSVPVVKKLGLLFKRPVLWWRVHIVIELIRMLQFFELFVATDDPMAIV